MNVLSPELNHSIPHCKDYDCRRSCWECCDENAQHMVQGLLWRL